MTANSGGTQTISTLEIDREGLTGRLYEPVGPPPHRGVLVLHGAGKGAYTHSYAEHLAFHGYAALRLEYFAAPGAPDTFVEIPIEYVDRALDWLCEQDDVTGAVGIVAWSRGTEAAFHMAAADDRVRATLGYVPSAYTFPAPTESGNPVSAWTRNGTPLPFVPPYEGIETDQGEPGRARFRRAVDRATEETLDRAALPVEGIEGAVLLVSGADDRTWPSRAFADTLAAHIRERAPDTTVVHRSYADAGHGIATPYAGVDEERLAEFGGTQSGTAYAAADAWEHALRVLRQGLRPDEG